MYSNSKVERRVVIFKRIVVALTVVCVVIGAIASKCFAYNIYDSGVAAFMDLEDNDEIEFVKRDVYEQGKTLIENI